MGPPDAPEKSGGNRTPSPGGPPPNKGDREAKIRAVEELDCQLWLLLKNHPEVESLEGAAPQGGVRVLSPSAQELDEAEDGDSTRSEEGLCPGARVLGVTGDSTPAGRKEGS